MLRSVVLRSVVLRSVVLGSLVVCGASRAEAQPEGPEQFAEDVEHEAPEEDKMSWELGAGGIAAFGNTRSWAAHASTAFAAIRGPHGVSYNWLFNIGQADLPDDDSDDYKDTVQNSNMRLRYDYYLSDDDALFLAAAHRWDPFAGLQTRVQAQAGYLRNLFRNEDHRIWSEIGFDYTFDNIEDAQEIQDPDTADNPLCDPAQGASDNVESRPGGLCHYRYDHVYAARLYLGFDHKPNENVHLTAGMEMLLNLVDPGDLRINTDAAMRSTIAGSLQLELKLQLLYDREPVPAAEGQPAREELDSRINLSLIYSLI